MPISEWEFFHVLEGHLCDALHAIVGEDKVPSHCPREVVKHVGKNFDSIFPAKVQSGLAFTSGAFMTISQVLNAKHHRQERNWAVVEEAVGQTLRILKELDNKFKISTAENVKELEGMWAQVEKSESAFSHRNSLFQAKAVALPPFTAMEASESPKNVQVVLSFPEDLIQSDIMEYLCDVQDISVANVDLSQPGIISFTVPSVQDVASIVPEFSYARKTVLTRIVQKIVLTLHPLPEAKTGEHVRKALKAVGIVPNHIHEPDPTTKTIMVEVGSQEDANLLRQTGVPFKPQNLVVLESAQHPFVVYLEVPVKSQEVFKALWENHYGFLPDPIHFSSDLKSVAFTLNENQRSTVAKIPPVKVNWRKALVVPYSPHRVAITFALPVDSDRANAAIQPHLSGSTFSLFVPHSSDETDSSNFLLAYVHLENEAAKASLLSNEIRIGPFVPPASIDTNPQTPQTSQTPLTPQIPQSPQPSLSKSNIPNKAPKGKNFSVSVSKDGLDITTSDVRQALIDESRKNGAAMWTIPFVFEREGQFYVDVYCEKPEQSTQVDTIALAGKQVPVVHVDIVPYYLLKLKNLPARVGTSDLFGYFKKEIKIFVGTIKLKNGEAIIPCAHADLQQILQKRSLKINNVDVAVSDATTYSHNKNEPPHPKSQLAERRVTIKAIEGQYLKRIKKEDLENIASEFGVKVRVDIQKVSKESKRKKQTKSDHRQYSILVQGTDTNNVGQAMESACMLINENDIKYITYKYANEKLVNMASVKIFGCLREFNTYDIVYFVKINPNNEVVVTLFGMPATVEEAAQSIACVRDLILEEKNVPPTLELDFTTLEAKYDVKTEFDKQTGNTKMFGTKESIAELSEHIQSKINNVKTTAHVKFGREVFLFLQRFAFGDPKWLSKVQELAVELNFNEKSGSVTIKGTLTNMRAVKDELLQMKAKVLEKTHQMTINKHLFGLLQEHVASELSEETIFTVRDSSVQKEIPQEDDGDVDDSSSTCSGISVGTTASSASVSSNAQTTNKKEKAAGSSLVVEVGVWYYSNSEAKVAKVIEGLRNGAQVQKVKYTQEDLLTIQKNYNFVRFQKRNKVSIFNSHASKTLFVSAFSLDPVKKTCEQIAKTLARDAIKTTRIALPKQRFFFLQQKRSQYLVELKQQLGLKRIELIKLKDESKTSRDNNNNNNNNVSTTQTKDKEANKTATSPSAHKKNWKNKDKNDKNDKQPHKFVTEGYCIEAEGHPEKLTRLEQELNSISLREEKASVQFGTVASLKEFEAEIKETYDVATFIKQGQPQEIFVTGETALPYWDAILARLASLKGVSEDYKPSDYSRLAEIVLKADFDLQAFANEYNLFKKPFFDRNKAIVKIIARRSEDIAAARDAFEGILNNKRIETLTIALPDSELAYFLLPGGPNSKSVEEVVKKHKLTHQWRHASKSLTIRGPNDVVHKAKQDIEAAIQGALRNITTKNLHMSSCVAAEFMKENNAISKACFSQSGTYVSFSDVVNNDIKGTNSVELELNLRYCKIQVVKGNITKEPTRCIVNAANQNLIHAGGIAQDIAQTAGEELNRQCAKIISDKGPLAVGSCVLTSAGKFPPPIYNVIHTVGPIWQNGWYNEVNLLKCAVLSALDLAEEHSIPSLSLPTISGGIFGYPIKECTQLISQVVYKFALSRTASTHLNLIRVCERDASVVQHFIESFKVLDGSSGSISETKQEKQEPSLGIVYQWHWMEDLKANTWKPFDPNENFQIEMAYLLQGRKGKMMTTVTGDLNQTKNGFTYEIDFDAMTELNTQYRATLRPIKREPVKQTSNFSWEIQAGPKGEWIKFDKLENQQIELAFFERKFQTMAIKWHHQQLILDFTLMQDTNNKMKLNRADVHYENQLQEHNRKAKEDAVHRETREDKKVELNGEADTVKCWLIGQVQDLLKGEMWIQNKIKEMTTTDVVSFEHNIPAVVAKELQAIKKKYGVTMQCDKNKITLTGLRMQVVQAKTEILEVERASSALFKAPPTYWTPQKQDLEIIEITRETSEWKKIEQRISETIANAKITQVQRIQNVSQWEKYCFLKDRISRKNGGDAAEHYLFHGTRANVPSLIYTGDDGFDMRYSAQGMWGRASYFAQNASYSHGYSYQLPNGSRQMFFARVSVGKNNHISPNGATVKPADGFDSVSGETGSSVVYMVYENGRGYPEYLVTYTA